MKVDDGLPPLVVARMLFNVVFDFIIGIVPFVGDVADAAFRANTRNAAILEAHLREKGKKSLRQSGIPLPDVDPSLGEEYDRIQESGAAEFVSEQPGRHDRMTPTEPEPARVRREGYSRRAREPDLEMGQVDREPMPSKAKTKSKSRQQR